MAKKNDTKTAPTVAPASDLAVPAGMEMDIPVNLIVADDEFNARKDLDGKNDEGHSIKSLAASIKTDGQLSPVLVASVKEHPGKFFLISGYRRFYSISRTEEQGGLGWKTIRATIYRPLDKKGAPIEASIKDLLFLNLIENEARKALNPFERAQRYHDLVRKHGESGNSIAKRVSLDHSYVNRLVGGMEMAPKLVERWRSEHSPGFDGVRLLTTDRINKLVKMKKDGTDKQDWESQLAWLDNELNPKTEGEEGEGEEGEGDGKAGGDKRTSLSQLKKGLVAAKLALKEAKNATDRARCEGVVDALKFAIKPQKIEGVLTIKDGGKGIAGPDGKLVAPPAN